MDTHSTSHIKTVTYGHTQPVTLKRSHIDTHSTSHIKTVTYGHTQPVTLKRTHIDTHSTSHIKTVTYGHTQPVTLKRTHMDTHSTSYNKKNTWAHSACHDKTDICGYPLNLSRENEHMDTTQPVTLKRTHMDTHSTSHEQTLPPHLSNLPTPVYLSTHAMAALMTRWQRDVWWRRTINRIIHVGPVTRVHTALNSLSSLVYLLAATTIHLHRNRLGGLVVKTIDLSV